MRGTIDDLQTPAPLAALLPSMLREDPFAVGLCGGLDEVLAPVLLTLDSYPAQLDVRTAPEDMLDWLAQWVGLVGPGDGVATDAERLRGLLAGAQRLHLGRGTRLGIERTVAVEFGIGCEVIETGAASWTVESGQPLPDGELSGTDASAAAAILVTVHPEPEHPVDVDRLQRLLASNVPAHVACRVQVG